MSDDLLERATRALREQANAEPPADRAAFMRARVLSQAKRRSQLRPQGVWQWAAVACLGFFVSSAMAHVIRVQLPRVLEALRSEQPAPDAAKPKRVKPVKSPQPRAAEPAAPNAPEPASAPPAVVPGVVAEEPAQPVTAPAPAAPKKLAPSPRRAKPNPAPAPSSSVTEQQLVASAPVSEPALSASTEPAEQVAAPSPPPRAAAESAELALFRRAQALHLTHDSRAIAAWDAYLRVAGSSALAPEARYNRALGLVRARRFAEARSALEPFASGHYGAYRRQEAQALLARLPK